MADVSVLQIIVFKEGNPVGSEAFLPGRFVIGSDPTCEVVLEGESVARFHAIITFADGRVKLQEASRGATLKVNGCPAASAEIRSRDDVAIGPYVLKLRVLGNKIALPENPTEPELPIPAPLPSAPTTPARLPLAARPQVAKPISTQKPAVVTPVVAARAMTIPMPPPAPWRDSDAPFGRPILRVRVFWGNSLVAIHGFPFGHTVTTGPDETLDVPLYRFELPSERFELARSTSKGWTARVPRSVRAFRFEPGGWKVATGTATPDALEVPLDLGKIVRLGDAKFSIELRAEAIKRVPAAGFAEVRRSGAILPASAASLMAASAAVAFALMPKFDGAPPDFTAKSIPAAYIKLIPPPPKPLVSTGTPTRQRPGSRETPEVTTPVPAPTRPVDKGPKPPGIAVIDRIIKNSPAFQVLIHDKMPGGNGNKGNYLTSPLHGRNPLVMNGTGFNLDGGFGNNTHGPGGSGQGTGGIAIGALDGTGIGHDRVRGVIVGGSGTNRLYTRPQGPTIPRELIAKIINQHINEVRGCYERALLQEPGLSGKVLLEWTIDGQGHVEAIKVREQTIKSEKVPNCVNEALRTWAFPAVGGKVVVSYPFIFNSITF